MAGRYEVLLRRGNGMNKTVIIEDCMSEQEARETAESMYGMEALRAIWKGSDSSYTSSSTPVSNNWSSSTDSSGAGILGLLGLALIGGIVMLVVQFWWLFLIIGVVLGGLIALGWNDSE